MAQVIQVQGTEKRLYQYVAPLVMDPSVLKQNYNYPFRTSENYVWFVALDGKNVVGFIPVERRKNEYIINNYYIKGKNPEVLDILLTKLLTDLDECKHFAAICFLADKEAFLSHGFSEEKTWTRYVKMNKELE